MPNQPTVTSLVSIESIKNRRDTPLRANETWTGDWDDIKDSATIMVSIVTDKPSADNGFLLQWSDKGEGDDVLTQDVSSINAATGFGRTGPITTRANFFRVKYINGTENQTFFRFSAVYKSAAHAISLVPLNRVIADGTFAQVVRSVLAGRKTDGAYINLMSTDDGKLVAVLYGTRGDGIITPVRVTDDGKLIVKIEGGP